MLVENYITYVDERSLVKFKEDPFLVVRRYFFVLNSKWGGRNHYHFL